MTDSNKPNFKILAAVAGFVVLVIVIVGSLSWQRSQQAASLLSEAQTYLSNRQYQEALTSAKESYHTNATKDAQNLIDLCQELIASEESFAKGLTAMESKEHADLRGRKGVQKDGRMWFTCVELPW